MTHPRQPLKTVASLNDDVLSETTDPAAELRYIDIGSVGCGSLASEPLQMRFTDAPSRARRVLRCGDTAISTVRTYLRAVLPVTANLDGTIASTGFAVVRPRTADPRFLSWVMQSDLFVDEVVARSVGVSYPAINPSEVATIPVPSPPKDQQLRIADYLDVEVSRIDELVALKKEAAFELDARAQAETEAVVLGLGEAGEGTSSPYFGHLPRGWGLTSLRHLRCMVQTGPFGSQLHAEDYIDGGWPVVNPANLRGGEIVAIDNMCISDEKRAELARHTLRRGDIVFGRRGEMGRAGLVTDKEAGWLCGTGSLLLRLHDPRILPDYLKALLSTSACRHYFTLNSVGSTMENLNSDIVLGAPVLVPPAETQARIVGRVRGTGFIYAGTSSVLLEQVELLRERRRSLITAAVTGEMEVP